ncbi:MAG: heme-binding protein [Acidimicrobiales bacterium]
MAHTFDRPSISLELSLLIVERAVAQAMSDGGAFCIAVVDESGVLKAFARMDGAPLLSVQVAQDKAYTAAGFGMPTDAWFDFIKDDEPLRVGAPSGISRLVVFGGGYPIKVGGAVVGGVGVSGGHYSQDMAVAEAGLRALDGAANGG